MVRATLRKKTLGNITVIEAAVTCCGVHCPWGPEGNASMTADQEGPT